MLEAENSQLRATTQQLGEQLGSKDAAILAMQHQLRQSAALLKNQTDKCVSQERQLVEAQQTLEAQRQQLRSSSLAGLDPQALSDRLLAIIKEALAEAQGTGGAGAGAAGVGNGVGTQGQQAAPQSLLMSDAVVQRISRTLTSCCRELVYATKGKQTAAAADTPPAIPVSCC